MWILKTICLLNKWWKRLTKKKILTARVVGPTCEVRFCLRGPPDRNSLLGVICQNPTPGLMEIHPCTWLFSLLHEYWYLSSTYTTTTQSELHIFNKDLACIQCRDGKNSPSYLHYLLGFFLCWSGDIPWTCILYFIYIFYYHSLKNLLFSLS